MLVVIVCPLDSSWMFTFDELPTQSVDGLSLKGVTFQFQVGGVSSTDATFNATSVGTSTFLNDPVLEGTTSGVLTLNFASPVTSLQFGVALSTLDPLRPGAAANVISKHRFRWIPA